MKINIQVEVNKMMYSTLEYQLRFFLPDLKQISFEKNNLELTFKSSSTITEKYVRKLVSNLIEKFSNVPLVNTKNVDYDISVLGEDEDLIRKYIKDFKNEVGKLSGLKISEYCTGLNLYKDELVNLFIQLDLLLIKLYKSLYDSKLIRPNSLLSTQDAYKAGYYSNGCQHLSFVSNLSHEFEEFENTIKEINSYSKVINKEQYSDSKYILNPALCVHCYPLLEEMGTNLGSSIFFTVLGKCFREESGNLNNKERLYEFQMGELVYIGDSKRINQLRDEWCAILGVFGEELGLDFKLETANDIFFDEFSTEKVFSQRVQDSKVEMNVYIPTLKKYISIGSVNFHKNHFTKEYDIKNENNNLESMCLAIGYDRLLLSLIEETK
ncbi:MULTISPECIES: aminoacyl--tRNA ligase-related protein [Bacillus cereus group]|uniref:Aminoacyl-transfer RNA synthetases class-II family profile domain-containing protein n=1 Tax=Bacillus thuringiensis serovar mexicanensis TaxID=180868 RepID=A0A2C9YH94_BACTU|nr:MULTISPECIES: aminoacyl--tRNA ligase-related protein [Bacillus cereus group]MEB9674045.1 hypothetical protein [Bacillus anthracis]OTW52668.1 hypothetical protein BK699_05845 [Bacillus thuringiensis serovar mexicanensis]OTX09974.1 hypothetical protein BK705_03720 [Bacillus thuringiensis serovar monterrey]